MLGELPQKNVTKGGKSPKGGGSVQKIKKGHEIWTILWFLLWLLFLLILCSVVVNRYSSGTPGGGRYVIVGWWVQAVILMLVAAEVEVVL